MTVDLQNYSTGTTYQTDIVIREKKYNQNICFTLCVTGTCDVPTAYPWDEDEAAKRKWLGWKRHFMCPPKDSTIRDDGHSEAVGVVTVGQDTSDHVTVSSAKK
jgi:hypothetical protein